MKEMQSGFLLAHAMIILILIGAITVRIIILCAHTRTTSPLARQLVRQSFSGGASLDAPHTSTRRRRVTIPQQIIAASTGQRYDIPAYTTRLHAY